MKLIMFDNTSYNNYNNNNRFQENITSTNIKCGYKNNNKDDIEHLEKEKERTFKMRSLKWDNINVQWLNSPGKKDLNLSLNMSLFFNLINIVYSWWLLRKATEIKIKEILT